MKFFIPLALAAIWLLAACESNDTKSGKEPSGQQSKDDTAVTEGALPPKDSSQRIAATSSTASEPVTPPEESDSLKFCYIKRFYYQRETQFIDADFIQFLTGEKAVEAARKHKDAEPEVRNGDTTWYLPNDYYVLNENARIRKLVVAPDVKCYSVVYDKSRMVLHRCTLQDLHAIYNDSKYYIITLNSNSVVTSIREQYVP